MEMSLPKCKRIYIFLIAYHVQVGDCRAITNVLAQCTRFTDCINGFEDSGKLDSVCNNVTGICNCSLSNCFVYNSRTNFCDLKKCHAFEELDDGQVLCVNHGGKSKRLALFLNIIAFTGAANFYVGNYLFALFQLALCLCCLALICSRVVCCCNLCCLLCKIQPFKCVKAVSPLSGKVCCCCTCSVTCCHVTLSVADICSVAVTGIEIALMVFDYVQIGSNEKFDGNGCALSDDTINLIQGIVLEVAKGL